MAVNEDFLLEEQEQEKRFVVDDDNKACWALRKIKEKQEKIEQKKELAETQIRQINEWLESETEKLEKSIEFLKSLLHEYAVRRSEEHTSELQSRENLVCRLLLEKKKKLDIASL